MMFQLINTFNLPPEPAAYTLGRQTLPLLPVTVPSLWHVFHFFLFPLFSVFALLLYIILSLFIIAFINQAISETLDMFSVDLVNGIHHMHGYLRP